MRQVQADDEILSKGARRAPLLTAITRHQSQERHLIVSLALGQLPSINVASWHRGDAHSDTSLSPIADDQIAIGESHIIAREMACWLAHRAIVDNISNVTAAPPMFKHCGRKLWISTLACMGMPLGVRAASADRDWAKQGNAKRAFSQFSQSHP